MIARPALAYVECEKTGMRRDHLLRFIDGCAEKIVDFTGELISTPSMTPPGDESEVAAVIMDRLDILGLKGACVVSEVKERPTRCSDSAAQRDRPRFSMSLIRIPNLSGTRETYGIPIPLP